MSAETNILLPTSGVDLFLKDKETMEAARSLVDDWRFARVTVNVEEGDVETAIGSYQNIRSPSLVIIETDTTDDSFIERLGALSEYCSETTNAIIIGPVNDVNLYRNLTSLGISDYLVKPVPLETLSEVIATTLIEKLGAKGSRLIGVVGSKGGVGTTALTQVLAWALSEEMDQKTILLDAAGGWSSLGVGIGFEPSASLHEAVKAAENKDEDTLARMYHKANDKLTVLATGIDPMLETSVQANQYEALIDVLMTSYPVVLVDLSGAIPSLKKTIINRAHELLLVTTPVLSSLRAARTLLQEVKLLQGGEASSVDLLVNMVGMASSKEVPKKDIAAALEYEPDAVIPFDPKLFLGAENEGKKITQGKEGKEVISALMPILTKLLGEGDLVDNTKEPGGVIADLLGKMTQKK
ncbi:MAG: AAA family ATPase [Alphaproteobacteria bacterium]|nr:AAA family ATPase [Alphaproteobacteria bacterium]